MEDFVDLYTDYLAISITYTTATGLASILSFKHDKITQALSNGEYDSKFLWKYVKPYIQESTRGSDQVVLGFDDPVQEKRYSDGSGLITRHFEHKVNRSVKGVNFLTAFFDNGRMRLPCAVEFVRKDKWEMDERKGKGRRVASKIENELFREMVRQCAGRFRFDYVMADSWYSSVEDMRLVEGGLRSNFIMALKSNRKVALAGDAKKRDYRSIGSLQPGQQAVEVWLGELDFPLLPAKQVFKNGDGAAGELYLACSDLSLSYEQTTTLCKKRWGVEQYHKSVKGNACFAKSPTKTIKTQVNHFMLSIVAYAKLGWLKQRTGSNHFAMTAKILLAAQKAAFQELEKLSTPKAA